MKIILTITVPDDHAWAKADTRPEELEVTDDEGQVVFVVTDGDGTYGGEVEAS